MKTVTKWFAALSLCLFTSGCIGGGLLDGLAAQDDGPLGPAAPSDPCVTAAFDRRQTCIGTADFRSAQVKACNRAFDGEVAACRRGPDAGAAAPAAPVPAPRASERSASYIDPRFLSGKW